MKEVGNHSSSTILYPLSDVYNTTPNNNLTQDTEATEMMDFIVVMLAVVESLIALLCLVGLVGNIINCVVFHRHGLRDRMNLCLFSLALSDLFFIASYLYFSITSVLSERKLFGIGREEYQKSVSYLYGVNFAFRTTSGLYVMVIAIERCVCVAFPLLAPSIFTTRTIGLVLIIFAIISQLGFVCQPLKYDVIQKKILEVYQWELVASKFYLSNKLLIDTIIYTVMHVSIPLITFFVVSLSTFMTVLLLTAAVAWRAKTSSTSIGLNAQQVALTKMLVLSSGVYIVSTIPVVLHKIVRLFVEEYSTTGKYHSLYDIFSRLVNGFPVINSSASFFVYYSRSSKYRKVVNKLNCRKLKTVGNLF